MYKFNSESKVIAPGRTEPGLIIGRTKDTKKIPDKDNPGESIEQVTGIRYLVHWDGKGAGDHRGWLKEQDLEQYHEPIPEPTEIKVTKKLETV